MKTYSEVTKEIILAFSEIDCSIFDEQKVIFVDHDKSNLDKLFDIDLFVVIKNDISIIKAIQELTPISHKLTKEFKKYTSIYPIPKIEFDFPTTEFTKNIKNNSIAICI